MNLYFCTEDSHDSGLYVAAESRGKAKRMYCDYCDSLMDFITVRTAKLWKPQVCGIVRRIKE